VRNERGAPLAKGPNPRYHRRRRPVAGSGGRSRRQRVQRPEREGKWEIPGKGAGTTAREVISPDSVARSLSEGGMEVFPRMLNGTAETNGKSL